jgi:hypothetical protein
VCIYICNKIKTRAALKYIRSQEFVRAVKNFICGEKLSHELMLLTLLTLLTLLNLLTSPTNAINLLNLLNLLYKYIHIYIYIYIYIYIGQDPGAVQGQGRARCE